MNWINAALSATLALGLVGCQNKTKEPVSIPKTEVIDLEEIDIAKIQEGYKEGRFTVTQVVQQCLDRIAELDKDGPQLNAILQINPDAIDIAMELDRELRFGRYRGPMHGIPVVLKDNIDTNDKMTTTAGSRALAGSHPLQDSWVATRLRESGAVILGKANLSEWANFHSSFSSSGWSAVGGQTKNPYDLSRNPCGSSAGSAVAVAASYCPLAIGTETWGSIVCPSNNNGIVGIKPTVGLISRSGIIPISFTQDTPGPMARNVRDAAICLSVLTGIDSADEKTLASAGKAHQDYTQFLKEDGLENKRIGWLVHSRGRHFQVDRLMEQAVDYLKSQGVEIIEIEQIGEDDTGDNSFQVLLYEFKDGLNKYFESLGDQAPVKSLEHLIEITLADSIETQYFDHKRLKDAQQKGDLESPEYLEALRSMLESARENGIDKIMNDHNLDAIIAPTGGPAWKTDLINGDRFGVSSSGPAAWAGYPNISVPAGYVGNLPVGISFFGRAWSEPLLLEIAYAYEQGTLHRRAPQF